VISNHVPEGQHVYRKKEEHIDFLKRFEIAYDERYILKEIL
jgi:hypothetical protein